jgi:2'-5' RNA ligase
VTGALETMRAFVALNLDVAGTRALASHAETLRERAKGLELRWVAPTKMHLTLKFLGEVDVGLAPALVDLLRPIAASRAAPGGKIAEVSAFPSPEEAMVIVALVSDKKGRIGELAEAVETMAGGLGFAREGRAYRPHVTLARARAGFDARAWLAASPIAKMDVRVTELVLYRSDRTRPGAEYTAVGRFAFGSPTQG